MRHALLVLALTGCGKTQFSVFADQVPEGMLLSGYSDGETLHIVGGDLAGGPGIVAHYDGKSLCYESGAAERALWWIDGQSAQDWYAVGEAGTILHHVETERSVESVDTDATLFGVWVDDDGAVWAVGGVVGGGENTGEVWKRDPDTEQWSAFATELPGVLFKVWGGFFVGDGVAYELVDDTLVEMDTGGARLLTLRGSSPTDVWAVGGLQDAVVMHYDGNSWEAQDTSGLFGGGVNGVWLDDSDQVYLAGHFGLTAFDADGSWEMPELPVTSEHFHAVVGHGEDVFWLGGNLLSQGDNYGLIARYGSGSRTVTAEPCD